MKGLYLRLRENSFKVKNYINLLKWAFIGFLVVVFGKRKIKRQHHFDSNPKFTPIFILGHWRSGTTYLQKALCAINGFNFVSVADVTTSSGSKLISIIFRFFISTLFSIIKIEDKFQRVRFTAQMPMEEMHAMMFNNCYHTSSWAFIFPNKAKQYFKNYLFDPINEGQKQMDINYKNIVENIITKKKQPNYLILKSPENTARIKRLLALYPNAKFIYIHRNPYDVYQSCLRFWEIIGNDFSVQKFSDETKRELILYTYKEMMKGYLEQRVLLSNNNLVEIEYDILRSAPQEIIVNALNKLGLMQESYNDDIKKFLSQTDIKGYKVNQYNSDTEIAAMLANEWEIGYKLWAKLRTPLLKP